MKKLMFIFLFLPFLLFSCEKPIEKESEDLEAKLYAGHLLDNIYYWYDQRTSASVYDNDIYEFFETSLYSRDRWSWMIDGETWNNDQAGVYLSYGGTIMQPIEYYNDYELKMAYIYPGSPYDRQGVTRGWTLTHLNDVPVMDLIEAGRFEKEYAKLSNRFRFLDLQGKEHEFTLHAEHIHTRSYLARSIFTARDYPGLTAPVGYFNYLHFNGNMEEDVTSTFDEFHTAGVKELILDLRYNGGGSLDVMKTLADYIAPVNAEGDILMKMKHNSKMQELDAKNILRIQRKIAALDLKRIFFLTGDGSASASEMIINGLKPYFPKGSLYMVGDTTYGKPNGMYVFAYPEPRKDQEDYYAEAEYVFLPICFYNVNKNDEGDYDEGLIPTHYRPDDLYSDWGVQEDLIRACLYRIVNGRFPSLPGSSKKSAAAKKGIRLSRESDLPGYGKAYLRP